MSKERGATITMDDMVKYYENVLANGGLSDSEREYITSLRDRAAGGTLDVSPHSCSPQDKETAHD